ncbi:MAG: mechanosensitive ion channel domain-containing protein [Planctomycetota bacterium]
MRRRLSFPFPAVGAVLGVMLLVLGTAAAQNETPPATPPPAATEEETKPADPTEARIQELEALEQPDEAQTSELEQLKAAVEFRKQAAASITNTKELADKAKAAPDQLAQIESDLAEARAALEAPLEIEIPPAPTEGTVEELTAALAPLRALLESTRAQQQAARELVRNATKRSEEADARKTEIPQEIATATSRREDVEQSLAAVPTGQERTPAQTARAAALAAEEEALSAKLDELDRELRTVEARSGLRAKRLELLTARSQQADRAVTAVQTELDKRGATIAARRTAEAEAARQEAMSQHEVIRDILDRNAQLAAERQAIAAGQRRRNEQIGEIDAVLEEWTDSFARIRSQIERVGLNDVVGIRLHNLRGRVLELRRHEQDARDVWSEIRSMQTRAIELEGQAFTDPRAEAERLLDESREQVADAEREEILAAATEALQTQKEFLKKLRTERTDYTDGTLLRLHEREVKLTKLVRQYLDFINQRILWIQSAPPVRLQNVGQVGRSIVWLLAPARWREVGGAGWTHVRARPVSSALLFLPFVALISFRPLLRRRLAHFAKKTQRASTDRFIYTLRATYVTVLLALTWPSVLWAAWRLLLAAGADSVFTTACADGMARATLYLTLILLAWHTCRPGGLGEAHFKWNSGHLRLVRFHLRWLTFLVIPLGFIIQLTERDAYRIHLHSLGRLAFCIGMLAIAFAAWRVFHPKHGLFERIIAKNPGGWLDRLRGLWFPAFVGFAPALGVAACLGYFLTARELFERLVESGWIVLGAVIVFSVLLRALYVAQRQLALEQARRRFEAAREARESEQHEGEAPSEEIPQIEELELDVESVSAQTRRLLVSGCVVVVLLSLFFVWREVFPAFSMLERVVLWLPSSAEAVVGTEIPPEAITAADVGLALIVAFVTLAISRNIPGVLEILILQRLPMSPGARYTITTLVRYAILIIGVVLTFDAIGIGWGKVQWLAAAVSVGLGFGLQEIFANFVSGLIILTERPVRVGDTVTIGVTSGTISRIQMRATTVVDWDRKELIIPNKQFVTGEIVNWTLSNAVLRLTLKVGIAYGSDTALAEKILLEVAEKEASVRDEPPPRAFFIGFGDNSLEFELRVFIDEVDFFSAIRHRLNMDIDARFREAGIEIAFPQRDLHIRSSDVSFGALPGPKDPEPGPAAESG